MDPKYNQQSAFVVLDVLLLHVLDVVVLGAGLLYRLLLVGLFLLRRVLHFFLFEMLLILVVLGLLDQ